MGTAQPKIIELTEHTLSTAFQTIADLDDAGASDSLTLSVQVDATGISEITFAFLADADNRPLMKANNGDFERDTCSMDLTLTTSFSFTVQTKGIHSLKLQAKANTAGGEVTSLKISRSGSTTQTLGS